MMAPFKTRRQKIGLVVLTLASVVMMAWIRSHLRYDMLLFAWGDNTYCLESAWGAFDIGIVRQPDNRTRSQWKSNILDAATWNPRDSNDYPALEDHLSELEAIDWRWDWGAFHFGAGHTKQYRSVDYTFPYWSIVVPLTALSMCLLLLRLRLN